MTNLRYRWDTVYTNRMVSGTRNYVTTINICGTFIKVTLYCFSPTSIDIEWNFEEDQYISFEDNLMSDIYPILEDLKHDIAILKEQYLKDIE